MLCTQPFCEPINRLSGTFLNQDWPPNRSSQREALRVCPFKEAQRPNIAHLQNARSFAPSSAMKWIPLNSLINNAQCAYTTTQLKSAYLSARIPVRFRLIGVLRSRRFLQLKMLCVRAQVCRRCNGRAVFDSHIQLGASARQLKECTMLTRTLDERARLPAACRTRHC